MRWFFLFAALLAAATMHAELPPSAYEAMQKAAADYLKIEVVRVEIEPGDAPGRQNVLVMALVNGVMRTSGGVSEGDLINISYTVTDREKGWSGPGEIPLLEDKEKTVAYLVKDEGTGDFHPAAGAMSFRNF